MAPGFGAQTSPAFAENAKGRATRPHFVYFNSNSTSTPKVLSEGIRTALTSIDGRHTH